MQWANALSTQPSLEAALREVVEHAQSHLHAAWLKANQVPQPVLSSMVSYTASQFMEPVRIHLAVLFVSSAFASDYSRVLPLLEELLHVDVLIGCSGGGVVGDGCEVEEGPAISLTLAHLPDVTLHPFHLEPNDLPDLDAGPQDWIELIGVPAHLQPQFVLLPDGLSSQVTDLLRGLDFAYPNAAKIGGLVSGGRDPRQSALFLGRQIFRTGTVGVALSGNLVLDTVVAQGCRPIGKPLQVSGAEGNIVTSLEHQPPLQVLQDLLQELDPDDQRLIRQSNALFVGLVTDEFKAQPEPGDFLVRMILGLDPKSGAIAIGDRIRPGQTLQFHLRDGQTSSEDLRLTLQRYGEMSAGRQVPPLSGALMFCCLGRGESLYGSPNHDTTLFQEMMGELPLGGFFCNGEIGPVGHSTFLHGFTSAIGLFRAAV